MRTVLLLLMGALVLLWACLADTVETEVAAGASGQYAGSAQQSVSAQGGNTTYVNLTGNANTDKWQGFYGNVSGSLRLGDGVQVLYDFGEPVFSAVYASSNASVDFGTVTGLGLVAQQVSADGYFGFGAGLDNITSVVDDAAACSAGTEIAGAGAVTTLNSTGGDWPDDTCFAGTIAVPLSLDDYVWGTGIVFSGAESFVPGLTVQYQMMVPVAGAGDLFYFYLEI